MRESLRRLLRGGLDWLHRRTGIQIYRDEHGFYSPLPGYSELAEGRELWDRPSDMVGVRYDLAAMRSRLGRLVDSYAAELEELDGYEAVKEKGLGEGFTILDSFLLYFMLRDLKPRRVVEIGAGFCTYYSSAALRRNAAEGRDCEHQVVEPNPWQGLRDLVPEGLVAKPAQQLPLDFFTRLDENDVLFIDTSHVVKVGGELTFLVLEAIPRLSPGVAVHVHDIHFPYNTPYPAERYIFDRLFPWAWTEAAFLQAFLAFNDAFEILVSPAMIRHDDALRGADSLSRIPGVRPLDPSDFDTHYGSIWIRRVA